LQAVAALNSITSKDIGQLKALKNPPDIVKRIFDCVLLLRMFPLDKPVWQEIKGYNVLVGAYETSVKVMSDSQFLNHLMNFPKEQINNETVELLQPYFSAPDFNFEAAQKASGNVAGLCNWAEAMCSYHNVATFVEPKIQALREAEAEQKIANKYDCSEFRTACSRRTYSLFVVCGKE
jgi:dynein heavy chain, axonemal